MKNSFITAYKLKNAYRVNSIIYALKHTPIIKRIFNYSLYSNTGLKIFGTFVSTIIEIISKFIWKLLYFICIAFLISLYKNEQLSFTHIFVFFTIIGAFLNTNMFNPSVDKYYAIMLMKFDAKKYAIPNYIYFLITTVVGLLPFSLIFGLGSKLSLITCLLMPLFVINVKNIYNAFNLNDYTKEDKVKNENKMSITIIIIVAVLLALTFIPPYFNIGINETIFYILFLISLILGIMSMNRILKYNNYYKIYRTILKKDEIIITKDKKDVKTYTNSIINEESITSDKKGYAYLNDIFVKRHSKLLTKATKNISIGAIIFFVLAGAFLIIVPETNKNINEVLRTYLPYYLFVMYFINRGQRICETMFMNCDHSMLTYRFYREPKAILSLFEERLKVLIKLNIIPGFIIALGTVILLYITGGTSIVEYIITFLTIISMSIFFSVHYLVLYYLLQPYDVNLEIKNPTFTVICGITYFICYMSSQVQIPTMLFGIFMILFSIIYSVVSLFLAYKYAPKQFKLRM